MVYVTTLLDRTICCTGFCGEDVLSFQRFDEQTKKLLELRTYISQKISLLLKVGNGPGLAFMTFSDALLQLDVPQLWSALFFFMLILLGIDSLFGTLEALIGPIMDLGLFPKTWRRELCAGWWVDQIAFAV